MNLDRYTKIVLTAIALFLAVIALRPYLSPPPTLAGATASDLYIEPGVHMLRAPDGSRQQLGKVVVDLRTGKIWGFPTGTDAPYPISLSTSEMPTSTPFLLGRFDMGALDK
ncbi:MAG: hypothetical protein ABR924_06840 [Terracidiphilus sp.]|jgi:hypothetical protein